MTANATRALLHWLHHLGGPGLILLGLLDNSIVPLPGSMDVATVVFCAREKSLWLYYVLMATLGSVVGGYATYRLARGGDGRWGAKLSRRYRDLIQSAFAKWGFGAIFIPALLPPPFPMTPFLIAAGATNYPRNKFLWSLALGRSIRYTILGVLGILYGHWIIQVIRQNSQIILWAGVAIVAASIAFSVARWKLSTRHAPQS